MLQNFQSIYSIHIREVYLMDVYVIHAFLILIRPSFVMCPPSSLYKYIIELGKP